jgi:hypothetical protein
MVGVALTAHSFAVPHIIRFAFVVQIIGQCNQQGPAPVEGAVRPAGGAMRHALGHLG